MHTHWSQFVPNNLCQPDIRGHKALHHHHLAVSIDSDRLCRAVCVVWTAVGVYSALVDGQYLFVNGLPLHIATIQCLAVSIDSDRLCWAV